MKKMSLISPDKIRNHLSNHSPSKITHAFTKSKRFITANPEYRSPDDRSRPAFYSSSSSLSKRQTSLGYGKKFDFTQSTVVSPAPAAYKMCSQFAKMNQTFTFSISRQQSPERSYLYHIKKARNPGPADYENTVKTSKSRNSFSYTNRARTLDVMAKHLSYLKTPGPGKYESLELNPKNGKFKISKFSDSKLTVIGRQKRFKPLLTTPGPLDYKNVDGFSDRGKFILSQRRGKGTRPFDHEKKFTVAYWKHDENPGPGAYEKPSEFGVYGDSKYYKSMGMTQ